MNLETIKYDKAINSAYFKQNLKEENINLFKTNFKRLLERINETESEEHNKNIVSQFLRETFYKNDYEINTAGRKDLVIHKGNTSQTPVSIIIEAKSPTNKTEMLSFEKPNTKAFHETIHYFLHERIIKQNKEIKHIIITNIYDWFIFDATDFEKLFYANQTFRNQYHDWHEKKLSGNTTDWFYNEIAKPFVEQEIETMKCVYLNLLGFKNLTGLDNNIEDDNKLINLYKILSPEHLLKLPFANDFNKIDTAFYNELLYILGLEETKDGGKKIIKRAKDKNRKEGSLIENTIGIIEQRHRLKNIERLDLFGNTADEQIFSIALELCITWLNRILFLKLLEAQLIKYHKGNTDFAFLNYTKIKDFDELDELFFEVLAKKPERTESVNLKFGSLPYLNSSLFEETELEEKVFFASQLKDRLFLPILPNSVLKQSEKFQNVSEINTLEYIFEFLNAYNFSSDTKAEIQKDNKTIINAAVLGLIFEKINGYKDGSFYTPSFITTFISREILKSTIVQKFRSSNLSGFKNLESFDDLKDKIEFSDKEQRQKANNIINSIKICDPAVGSGHFLVSVLNELVAIKSELKILQYTNGNRIKGIIISNNNDELEIIDEETSEPFQYYVNDKHQPIKELQEIQQSLFNEKRILIEKCLFGVDINPKSVLICRLRLWIELLKSSFYTENSNFKYLETLPNIDINIKSGDSLISFFDFNGNGTKNGQLQKLQNFTKEYKTLVGLYKNEADKMAKEKIVEQIKQIRTSFMDFANPNDKEYKLLKEKDAELTSQFIFFSKDEQDEWKIKHAKLQNEVNELKKWCDNKRKEIYKNAFEWRFEFPEVLDDNGKFEGFDAIVGNPPYIMLSQKKIETRHLFDYYKCSQGKSDTYRFFIELCYKLLKENGSFSFIVPKSILTIPSCDLLRRHIIQNYKIEKIINFSGQIFDEASVNNIIFKFQKGNFNNYTFQIIQDTALKPDEGTLLEASNNPVIKTINEWKNDFVFNIEISDFSKTIVTKIIEKSQKLMEVASYSLGMQIYHNTLHSKEEMENKIYHSKTKKDDSYFPETGGKNIKKYNFEYSEDVYVSYCDNSYHKPNWNFFENERVVVREIMSKSGLVCAVTDKTHISNKSVIIIKPKEIECKYLLAILNSKLISFFVHQTTEKGTQKLFPRISLTSIKNLPIIVASTSLRKKIIKLVDKIIIQKTENLNTEKFEKELDFMIYKLYELNNDEIKTIENE